MTALPPPPFSPGVRRCRSKSPDGVTRCHLASLHESRHAAKWPSPIGWRAWTGGGRVRKAQWWVPTTTVEQFVWQFRIAALDMARSMRQNNNRRTR